MLELSHRFGTPNCYWLPTIENVLEKEEAYLSI